MATVYKVEVVSDWINYTKEDMEELIQDALDREEERRRDAGKAPNEVVVHVLTRG